MDGLLNALQYIGLLTTSAMAVYSLFFEFTQKIENSERKRLTRAGAVALTVICVGIVASVGSTVLKDMKDQAKGAKAEVERERLLTELRLASEVFKTLEVHLIFAKQIDWRAADFLAAADNELLYGSWADKSLSLASWRFTKAYGKRDADSKASVLYVERRPERLARFIDQNPQFANRGVDELTFVSTIKHLEGYQSPSMLYLYEDSKGANVNWLNFKIERSPQQPVWYEGDDFKGLKISADFTLPYSAILESKISLSFSFQTPKFERTGPSIFDRAPVRTPLILKDLAAIDIVLNGRKVARAFDAAKNKIQIRPNSQWDIENNGFQCRILSDFQLTRSLIAGSYSFVEK